MAVPSSGQLRLYADIGVELGVAQSNVSLGSMSNSAGFPEPDAMSDFYGYVDAIAPSVTTNAIDSLGETSLRANGNVTSDGGGTITERGFYIGTNSASPTNNPKYTVGGTTGSYSYNASGLNTNTTYYVWAFATNLIGTTYGSRVQAATYPAFVPVYGTSYGTSAVLQSYQSSSGAYMIQSFTTYYQNPNTGGLVTIRSENEQGIYTDLTSSFNFGSASFAKNAVSYIYSLMQPFSSNAESTVPEMRTRYGSGAYLRNTSIYPTGWWYNVPITYVADDFADMWIQVNTPTLSYYQSYIVFKFDFGDNVP
jgi:hypothetical protein